MSCTRIIGPVLLAVGLLVAPGCNDGPGVSVVTTTSAGTPDGSTVVPDADPPAAAPTPPPDDSAPPVATTLAPGQSAPFDAPAADDLLASFDTADLYAFSMLSAHRGDPTVLIAARRQLDAGATGDVAWAATYVWVNEGDDVAPLIALVDDPDPAIRVMAATGLLSRGRIEGFEPLIALIVDDSVAPGWPPSQVWQDAVVGLVRFTAISDNGPPFDATPNQRQDATARWQTWFDAHRDGLSFDAGVALWTVA